MGDYFQIIVDCQVSLPKAAALASRIRDWLIDEGIIDRTMTNCVLDEDDIGYPPGANFEQAVESSHDDTRELWTNGLSIIVGREVFDSSPEVPDLLCRHCNAKSRTAWDQAISDAMSQWREGDGVGDLTCPACGHSEPITKWIWDPPWGFGNLGFKFWNWPPLKASFLTEFAERLGHRMVLVTGKL
jgi:hypothetical protein